MEGDMNINVVTLSQTGNTRAIAEEMAGVFKKAGHAVRIIPLAKATADDALSADLFGVGAPCFVSQAPTPVRKFLWKLPSLVGKKAFVFATSGGAPGRVLWDMASPLMMNGAKLLGGFICRGTLHHPAPCLVNRFPDRPDANDKAKAREFAASVMESALTDAAGAMDAGRKDAFRPGIGFYDIVGAVMKDPLQRLLLPVPRADETCTACGWCVEECPTGSMKLDPAPSISNKCIRCYRCMNGCPEKALSVKWGISNFMIWTLYNQTFERLLGEVRPGEKIY
jgi:ferredoxin